MKPDEMPSTNITKLWISNNQKDQLDAEDSYWRQVSDANIKLEKELEILESSVVSQMSSEEFYTFLHDTHFVWKYTAKMFTPHPSCQSGISRYPDFLLL